MNYKEVSDQSPLPKNFFDNFNDTDNEGPKAGTSQYY